MNTIKTGKYIALKRKEQNMTQEQLADKIGVTNKTVSKWETGRCMPDYSVIDKLCIELKITSNELLSGESCDKHLELVLAEKNSIQALEQIQKLEKEKQSLIGILLIVMGIALYSISQTTGGTTARDFISGIILGLSIGSLLVGVYVTARTFTQKK